MGKKESMKTRDNRGTIFFTALCAITLISAVAFPFARDTEDDIRLGLAILILTAPAGLLVWSALSFRKNLVRGTTGILVLLVAGFLALTMTGWRIHNRIDTMVSEWKETIWFQTRGM